MSAQLRDSLPGTEFRKLYDGGNATIHDCYSAYNAKVPYWKPGASIAFLCSINTFKALVSADFSATAKCNYYKTSDEFHTMNLAMVFQAFHYVYMTQIKILFKLLNPPSRRGAPSCTMPTSSLDRQCRWDSWTWTRPSRTQPSAAPGTTSRTHTARTRSPRSSWETSRRS